MSLDQIKIGEFCIIDRILDKKSLGQKLLDMGFVPGTRVKVVRNAPLLDPIKVMIRGYHLAIRRSEAKEVLVKGDESCG